MAFGGTVGDNWRDWIANLRWIIPFHNDEYTKVVKEFCPAFVCALLKRIEDQPLLLTNEVDRDLDPPDRVNPGFYGRKARVNKGRAVFGDLTRLRR